VILAAEPFDYPGGEIASLNPNPWGGSWRSARCTTSRSVLMTASRRPQAISPHLWRKREDRSEVLLLKAGMLVEDLLLSYPVRQPARNVVDRHRMPRMQEFPCHLPGAILMRG
jgi:hypothetical protein